jgi:flagellar protein FliO/FliZ
MIMTRWVLLLLVFTGNLAFAQESEIVMAAAPAAESNFVAKSEEEIPVNLATSPKPVAEVQSKNKYFYGLAITIVLMMISVFLGRKYFSKAIDKNPNTQIKLLTQFHLGPKKKLAIVRVAGESMLIGVTDQNVNLIKSLSLLDEDIPEVTAKDFGKELTKSETAANLETGEEFSISGVRDFVSNRLRNMRSL